jgi:hypothetical protein
MMKHSNAGDPPALFRYLFFLVIFFLRNLAAGAEIVPVLEFPEPGMDDPVRYQEYRTRFYRDSSKNALQIYLNTGSGRVVNLWADAANESLSFTVRDSTGKSVSLQWCEKKGIATSEGNRRFVEYSLCSNSLTLEIGHFLLSSMRKERDFQYFKKDLVPYDAAPFYEPELLALIAHVEKLPSDQRPDHLKLMNASKTEQLRKRMDPVIGKKDNTVSLEQISFDGKNHLWLQLTFNNGTASIGTNQVSVKADQPIRFQVKVGTDSAALSPLDREEIFNKDFVKFYHDLEKQASSSDQASKDFKWLEREVRGMELVCYQEKLMAGLPNFATYFGRDTMMSAFMFESVWSDSMMEHAIVSVLLKLGPRGDASHEEALGGQAIRENAGEYNKLVEEYFRTLNSELLAQAKTILKDLQKIRENYNMVDDDFQLPVLIGRYLRNPKIAQEKKRAFLVKWLDPILKNFAFVAAASRPYLDQPDAVHLVSFPKRDDGRWQSSSWRDSNAGYAGGRFAMDVNAVWVPAALDSINTSLQFLTANSIKIEPSQNTEGTKILLGYAKEPQLLQKAIEQWRGAIQHFWVHFGREEVIKQTNAKLESLPSEEKAYWKTVLTQTQNLPERLEFLALSLDEAGKPIPVLNTDPATWLFVDDHSKNISSDKLQPGTVYKILDSFVIPYPVGLFVKNLGPLCANDAYTSPAIWKSFEEDQYHSPRVVWGREVNLLTLGLVKEILQSADSRSSDLQPYTARLKQTLKTVRNGVEESGLKHNELWSYKIQNGKLTPVRYGSSTDIQLWSLTDISIQFLLSRIE